MARSDGAFAAQQFTPSPQKPGQAKHAARAGGIAGTGLIALGLACAGLKPDEGYRARTYLDVAAIPTYCYGHADRKSKVGDFHSQAECNAIFARDVGATEKGVEKCTPVLDDRANQLAAATRLTYNIGIGAYCRSKIAKNFNAGNIKAGCIHFLDYRFAAGKPVLLPRREREEALCLKGL